MKTDTPKPRVKGEITGWHALGFFILFFGTIIAVNLYMATKALSTFGGVVVENSYVASQNYNGWLAEARAQKALGWSEDVVRGPDGIIALAATDALKTPLVSAHVSAVAQHPLGRAPDVTLNFTEDAPGHYRATTALPAGRWQVHFTIQQGGRTKNLLIDMNEKSGVRGR